MLLLLGSIFLSAYVSANICFGAFDSGIVSVFFFVLLFIALMGLALLIMLLVNAFIPQKEIPNPKTTLYSLKNGTTTSGSFFLGIGTLEGVQTAFYSTKEEDGAIVFRHTSLEDARIYEDEQGSPYFVDYTSEFKSTLWYLLAPKLMDTASRIDFHIPAGSVLQGYSIN